MKGLQVGSVAEQTGLCCERDQATSGNMQGSQCSCSRMLGEQGWEGLELGKQGTVLQEPGSLTKELEHPDGQGTTKEESDRSFSYLGNLILAGVWRKGWRRRKRIEKQRPGEGNGQSM